MNELSGAIERMQEECKLSELSKNIDLEKTKIDDLDKPIVKEIGEHSSLKMEDTYAEIDKSIVRDVERQGEPKDVTDEYYSTYKERLDRTPNEAGDKGEWTGQRGESIFIPNDENMKQLLEEFGLEGIAYTDGIPDFSEVSECTVEIDNMSDNRYDNFKQCDQKCADKWNDEAKDGKTDWTARDVQKWREENGYTWHERNDMKTCDLVPTEVNQYFTHLGGVSECKKRDAENIGGDFDE